MELRFVMTFVTAGVRRSELVVRSYTAVFTSGFLMEGASVVFLFAACVGIGTVATRSHAVTLTYDGGKVVGLAVVCVVSFVTV